MNRTLRTVAAAGCGLVAGLAIGPAVVLMANVSDTLMRGWAWPDVNAEYAQQLLAASVPTGANGAIGAALAAGWGSRRRLGVTILPAGLHVVAAVWALVADPQMFLLLQLVSLMFTVVMWPAGRLGQWIGWAFRGRSPGLSAGPGAAPAPARISATRSS